MTEAIDLSHHLSQLARERQTSPLKGMYKYFQRPGIKMLAGGLPSPAYFPFETLSANVLPPQTFIPAANSSSGLGWLWNLLAPSTKKIEVPKYAADPKDPNAIQLAVALQYGTATGIPPLANFIREFTGLVFTPAYTNWTTLINAGSTDAWGKIATMLGDRGDGILCEEWTYPSALSSAWPAGLRPVPIPMDGAGMTPEGMEKILAEWNLEERGGMKRPTILYTVPVCQNPTGATMPVERKKAIYEVAVKYDVIIVEDDPYYFLQAGEYEPPAVRAAAKKKNKEESDEEFLKSLIPSYLKYDYQGRVIRIDTFSKTIAPGSRMGWITCNPLFAERMERANESSSQSASGFAQALIGKLLVEEWGVKGYLSWLKGLKAEYRDRRDSLVDSLLFGADAALDARESSSVIGAKGYELFVPRERRMRDEKGFLLDEKTEYSDSKLLSFVAPEGGMFVWLRVHTSLHPSYGKVPTADLIMGLWEAIAEANVLIAPGTMFSATEFGKPSVEEQIMEVSGDGFFRIAFSSASADEMKESMKVVGRETRKFWNKKF
ncbi:hypothetical protein MNV49_007603 [Pseudohyphozyma bogoriensis]|nr:hypothetical protein MNV49_007603 [Pseudohyphozyma bogoriensis]